MSWIIWILNPLLWIVCDWICAYVLCIRFLSLLLSFRYASRMMSQFSEHFAYIYLHWQTIVGFRLIRAVLYTFYSSNCVRSHKDFANVSFSWHAAFNVWIHFTAKLHCDKFSSQSIFYKLACCVHQNHFHFSTDHKSHLAMDIYRFTIFWCISLSGDFNE